ncbi:chaperone clpb, putative [Ricinus communis]|uniref:Chaperone clpb, putative n=1 Tax=Ricinus communis TaxID=3988 RepID=B9RGZ6_RICCO|nr:chaperone clpb, putative [Ricinus communis]
MLRIDMSEYMEKHSVSKHIGSPPGYICYNEGGKLTEAVRRRPHTLILFDEIEKAHGDVYDVFLQILDDGILTDGKGQKVDFKNSIIILTSNIGGKAVLQGNKHGFEQVKGSVAEKLKKHLRPEFLNRIDEVIVFEQLAESKLQQIVEMMLEKVYQRLNTKNIELQVTGYEEEVDQRRK